MGANQITPEDLAGGQYNSSPNTLADGQRTALQLDNLGNLKTTAAGSGPGGTQIVSPLISTTMTTSQVTVSSTAVQLLAANTARVGASIVNDDTTILFIGGSSGITAANGVEVAPNGGSYNIDSPLYRGAVYGIRVAAGTGVASTVELT